MRSPFKTLWIVLFCLTTLFATTGVNCQIIVGDEEDGDFSDALRDFWEDLEDLF